MPQPCCLVRRPDDSRARRASEGFTIESPSDADSLLILRRVGAPNRAANRKQEDDSTAEPAEGRGNGQPKKLLFLRLCVPRRRLQLQELSAHIMHSFGEFLGRKPLKNNGLWHILRDEESTVIDMA